MKTHENRLAKIESILSPPPPVWGRSMTDMERALRLTYLLKNSHLMKDEHIDELSKLVKVAAKRRKHEKEHQI